jgi:hypothetical protein
VLQRIANCIVAVAFVIAFALYLLLYRPEK